MICLVVIPSVKSIGGMPQVYISCIKRDVKLGVLREVFALCLECSSMSTVNIPWPELRAWHILSRDRSLHPRLDQ